MSLFKGTPQICATCYTLSLFEGQAAIFDDAAIEIGSFEGEEEDGGEQGER